jgi:3-polyprenyl-4-hydroxybenzoate decarboxylase
VKHETYQKREQSYGKRTLKERLELVVTPFITPIGMRHLQNCRKLLVARHALFDNVVFLTQYSLPSQEQTASLKSR